VRFVRADHPDGIDIDEIRTSAWLLTAVYDKARVIHVILDNYGIHSSEVIGIALCHFARRIRLHPLPPYCPDDNRIERVWQDLHAKMKEQVKRPDGVWLWFGSGEVREKLRAREKEVADRLKRERERRLPSPDLVILLWQAAASML
jgi:transposase